MNDTEVTVVGTVLTEPKRRKVEKTGQSVTTFLVIANSRRFDRERNEWVDGPYFRIRVNCWRRLADNVAKSVFVGEPVIAKGRITTDDWEDENGQRRTQFEMEAWAIGHDLSRGTTVFTKSRPENRGGVVVDEDPDGRVNGEPTRLVDDDGLDQATEAEFDDYDYDQFAGDDPEAEAAAILESTGIDPGGETSGDEGGNGSSEEGAAELVGAGPGSRSRRRGR